MKLSIVIVSMNNVGMLFPCLDSIYKNNNTEDFEIFVVAYLFTSENKALLRKEYPGVIIIESDEIRGFSENNNLALRKAMGDYCLVINDDTYFTDNSIEKLIAAMEADQRISMLSPVLYDTEKKILFNGRHKLTFLAWLLIQINMPFLIWSHYQGKQGIYRTYNISGACFMARRKVLETLGYFDEHIFFSPEDILLSTEANKKSFYCYVDTSAKIIHHLSRSAKKIYSVIIPVARHGHYYFFKKEVSSFHSFLSRIITFLISLIKYLAWSLRPGRGERKRIMRSAHAHVVRYAFSSISPKELFVMLYGKL